METWLPLIIQLVSGAIGGNIAGSAMKGKSLGGAGNSIAGAVGGGLLGQLLNLVGLGGIAPGGSIDLMSIITAVAGGGVGGGALMAIISALRGGAAKS